MKTKLALSAIVAAVAVFSQSAFAQASSPTRAEVKAETRAAEKSGKLTPAGEATPKSPAPAVTAIPLGRASLRGSVPPTRQLREPHQRWPIWCCCA